MTGCIVTDSDLDVVSDLGSEYFDSDLSILTGCFCSFCLLDETTKFSWLLIIFDFWFACLNWDWLSWILTIAAGVIGVDVGLVNLISGSLMPLSFWLIDPLLVCWSYFPINCFIDLSSADGLSLSRLTSLEEDFISEYLELSDEEEREDNFDFFLFVFSSNLSSLWLCDGFVSYLFKSFLTLFGPNSSVTTSSTITFEVVSLSSTNCLEDIDLFSRSDFKCSVGLSVLSILSLFLSLSRLGSLILSDRFFCEDELELLDNLSIK